VASSIGESPQAVERRGKRRRALCDGDVADVDEDELPVGPRCRGEIPPSSTWSDTDSPSVSVSRSDRTATASCIAQRSSAAMAIRVGPGFPGMAIDVLGASVV